MSCSVSSRVRSTPLALAGVLGCVLMTGALAAGQGGRPIEFSAPSGAMTVTNANQFTIKQPAEELLRQSFREGLLGSLDIFGVKSSLSGVAVPAVLPPASPPVQNQRVKELLERRKNWAFMTPDDFKNEQTMEELLKLQKYDRDGQEEKKQSPIERYYESLVREKLGNTNRLADAFAEAQDSRKEDVFSPGTGPAQQGNSVLQTESRLRNLFGSETASAFSLRGGDDGLFSRFSSSAEPVSMERTPAQKAWLEEFKQLLEPRLPVAPPAALANPFNAQPDVASPASVLSAQPRPVVSPLFGSVKAEVGTRPGGFPAMDAGSAGSSSFAPALSAEPARVAPPVLTIPKRKF